MLRIFSNIRQSLLNENKTFKYLKYAVGEVLLIMIGILLALQVNNWNEERLLKKEVRTSLVRLAADLERDVVLFDRQARVLTGMIQSAQRIQALLKQENDISDLAKISSESLPPRNFDYHSSTYESLVNTGVLYNIKEQSLSGEITEYYRGLADLADIMTRHNDEISRFQTREVLDPFSYLFSASERSDSSANEALIWMNDETSPAFQATQVYLSSYIKKYSFMRKSIRESHLEKNKSLAATLNATLE